MILVDSSAWIEYLRATDGPVDRYLRAALRDQQPLAIVGVVLLEVLAGARDEGHARRLTRLLGRCRLLVCEEPSDHEAAAALHRVCRREGVTIRRPPDLLIATIAIRTDTPLLHLDADFDAIARHAPLRIVAPARRDDAQDRSSAAVSPPRPAPGAGGPSAPDLPLRACAPGKINLGLFLGPTRADGRHGLVTVMQSISLADELLLEVADRQERVGGGDVVLCPGVAGEPGENLAARALAAFRAATGWAAPPLRLSVAKRVPVAAGLGGGSGDAAAALRLAAAASGLGDEALLLEIAGQLGADVPAQVRPGRWLATGAGEVLEALPPPSAPLGVLVLPAAGSLSTAAVYAQADSVGGGRPAAELDGLHEALAGALADGAPLPPEELLANDLQGPALALCPEIDAALALAWGAGADVAIVSGSGPTVLGLFAGDDGPRRARAAVAELATRRAGVGAPAPIAAEPVAASFAAPRPEPGR
ncbi:MAG TPA: PIN domain-containing protein [Solirubrobacteraceae bacterium]|nr:PIN domain-containing protein [Solirubrobacteraceae bacterium]